MSDIHVSRYNMCILRYTTLVYFETQYTFLFFWEYHSPVYNMVNFCCWIYWPSTLVRTPIPVFQKMTKRKKLWKKFKKCLRFSQHSPLPRIWTWEQERSVWVCWDSRDSKSHVKSNELSVENVGFFPHLEFKFESFWRSYSPPGKLRAAQRLVWIEWRTGN
jgi:hypothetical protein